MDVPVYNMKGAQVGTFVIDEKSLGGEISPALIKQAYVRYHANTRQGSARTKNREAVEGATRKIYKQKGTGRARHGDKKVPQFKGGGHAHSKKRTREDYRLDMPKKMRRKANLNALLAKLVVLCVPLVAVFALTPFSDLRHQDVAEDRRDLSSSSRTKQDVSYPLRAFPAVFVLDSMLLLHNVPI